MVPRIVVLDLWACGKRALKALPPSLTGLTLLVSVCMMRTPSQQSVLIRRSAGVMTNQTRIIASIIGTAFLSIALLAQNSPPGAQVGKADIAGLPAERGIYYHAANRWVALQFNIVMPVVEERAVALQILNLGSDHAVSEIPGAHAGLQIREETQPTFYLRGITPTELYLVRAAPNVDSRELWMPISGNFAKWAHFRARDIANIHLQTVATDVMTVQPVAKLKPGEYILASVFEPGAHWIRLAYGFGLTAGRSEK